LVASARSLLRSSLVELASASDGNAGRDRDVIWSGACSSGGNKTKTWTFTVAGNATVTANVQ
jgi:hypothetical protein